MITSTIDCGFRQTEYTAEDGDWQNKKPFTFSGGNDGLDVNQLEADLEKYARQIGVDIDAIAESAGVHFQTGSIVPTRLNCLQHELNELVNAELEAFRN